MPKKLSPYVGINEICAMFVSKFNMRIQRTAVYNYIRNYDFPANTGIGRPRQWERIKVEAWFKAQKKA